MTLTKAIIATLVYHDLFDYPLTALEIQKFLIYKKSNPKSLKKALLRLTNKKKIASHNNYYCLYKRNQISKTRVRRKNISEQKLKKALLYSKILRQIPTIKLLALTGSLAMENSTKSDDIDFMIITTRGNIWVTRFLANIALFFYKRSPKTLKKSNRVCLNIFIDESDLKITQKNLYTAHEIAQIKVLWGNNDTSRKFFNSNKWVKSYLPNFNAGRGESKVFTDKFKFPRIIERFCKFIQLQYMKSKITTETIRETQLFFHPHATQTEILQKYSNKLKKLKYLKISSPLTLNDYF